MRDLFIAYAVEDQPAARDLADALGARGLTIGPPLGFGPHQPDRRLVRAVDAGLASARFAVVIVSAEFLKRFPDRKALDALAGRRRVVLLLCGIDEAKVGDHSPRLAVAAIPGELAERLVRLIRRPGDWDGGDRDGEG